jgi:hypothetical protein
MSSFIESLHKDRIYRVTYDGPGVPELARELKPTVYADTPEKDTFCCILGEDPQSGTFGCGATPLEAMKDWEKNYQKDQDELKNTN